LIEVGGGADFDYLKENSIEINEIQEILNW
jgi:hypothetical protein